MRGATIVGVCAALVTSAAVAGQPPLDRRETTVLCRPQDQQARRYAYVPVDVPDGVTRLTIEYEYDQAGGGNAIDLGLAEPGPLPPASSAMRGWSGGARRRIEVGTDAASPGYWPGAIPAGRWHVMLGLYRVAPAGVAVTVRTTFFRAAATATAALPPRQEAPIRAGTAWYAGIVHAHTIESDGELDTPALIERARAERLDFIAITDHNNTTHQRYPLDRPDLLVISGEEVTTPAGHFNVLGLAGARDVVDFRFQSGDPALAATMAAVRARGAVVAINHPVSACLACSWTHAVPEAVDAIEIANGTAAAREQAMATWDTLLRAGRRITAVEGRDWHGPTAPLGSPVLRVRAAALSRGAVLDAIRGGRAVVLASAALPVPELTASSGGRHAAIGDTLPVRRGEALDITVRAPPAYRGTRVDWVWNGETVESAPAARDIVRFTRYPAASGYGRAHVVAADGTFLAVTNPVYVTVE